MERKKKTVVVIGAGPAGLTAARELLYKSQEYKVIILEKSEEIGGISRTIRHNGNYMDIGGHRFFSKYEKVNAWWNYFLPLQGKGSLDDILLNRKIASVPTGADPEMEDRVMLHRTRISRILYNNKFFDYPVTLSLETLKNLGLFQTILTCFSYLKTISKKNEDNLEDFYINRFGYQLYTLFFESYTEKLWGRHPKNISADWGLQRVKGLSLATILKDIFNKIIPWKKKKKIETSLIPSFLYPKYGPGQLWELVAEEILNLKGVLVKNAEVLALSQENQKISSIKYREQGQIKEIPVDIVISSMPLKDLILGISKVPPEEANIAEQLPYRDFVTVGILVHKLNIKNTTKIKTISDRVPDCWIYVQDNSVKLGRIQIFNNWSPYLVKDFKNTVWIGTEYFCSEGDTFWNLSESDCVDFVRNELIKLGIITESTELLDYHRERIQKAYPAYFDSYKDIDKLIAYADSFSNLYCVGRNGQHRYNNMDHSMITAFETVDNIINHVRSKGNIWNVNTEQEYQEEKK